MGHNISGVIGSARPLAAAANKMGFDPPLLLNAGFAFVPLDSRELKQLDGEHQPLPGFEYLSPELVRLLAIASQSLDLAYVETHYFGGTGDQGAAVFQEGSVVFGPKVGENNPINEALRALGIVARGEVDEFDLLGLGRFRSNDKWRESAIITVQRWDVGSAAGLPDSLAGAVVYVYAAGPTVRTGSFGENFRFARIVTARAATSPTEECSNCREQAVHILTVEWEAGHPGEECICTECVLGLVVAGLHHVRFGSVDPSVPVQDTTVRLLFKPPTDPGAVS